MKVGTRHLFSNLCWGPWVCLNGQIENVWFTFIAKYLLDSNGGNQPLCKETELQGNHKWVKE